MGDSASRKATPTIRGRLLLSGGDGGFHWQVVGLGTAGKNATQDILNTVASNGIGDCGASTTAEQACSLDAASATGLTAGTGGENPVGGGGDDGRGEGDDAVDRVG